jgi:hypothetical protein
MVVREHQRIINAIITACDTNAFGWCHKPICHKPSHPSMVRYTTACTATIHLCCAIMRLKMSRFQQ